jgi:3-hydroxybutyryl-CoA dehydrogenase
LPVTAIASAAKGPERVVGLHFFNPVPAMKLLEIVQGERFRPPQLLRRMVRAGKLGKKSGEGFYKY